MPRILLLAIALALAAASCQARLESSTGVKQVADSLSDPRDTDAVEPTLGNMVEEFRDSVQKESILDTTRYGRDTLRLVIHQKRIEASSFLLPKTYLEEAQLDSFRAWNMSSDVQFFVNGRLIVEKNIQKGDFTCGDASIRKYGVLMEPEVDSLSKDGFVVDYSLSIPLTDVAISLKVRGRGRDVICSCSNEPNE